MGGKTKLQRTPLYAEHIGLGASMTQFGGYEMPVRYKGILAEHETARTGAVVFDTCHMGEIRAAGPQAESFLDRLLTCPISSLPPGRCRYGMMCREDGGVLDDLIVYRFDDQTFMLVVNAGTRPKDVAWIEEQRDSSGADVAVEDVSDVTAKIDLQGPGSVKILQRVLDTPIAPLRYFHFTHAAFRGAPVLVSRTGYTGEIGFELYIGAEQAAALWRRCLDLGAAPAGLGARDTLRLEMGYPLYGHELREEYNAAWSGLHRVIAPDKDFIGAEAVRGPRAAEKRLAGIVLEGRRAAREGASVLIDGRPAGHVTSGSFAPSVGRAAALAYIAAPQPEAGASVRLDTGRAQLRGTIADLPFYKNGTVRRPFAEFA